MQAATGLIFLRMILADPEYVRADFVYINNVLHFDAFDAVVYQHSSGFLGGWATLL